MIIIPTVDLPNPDGPSPLDTTHPRELLQVWESLGFKWVQLVEPEARDDRPLNRRLTEELLRDVRIGIQVAGAIGSIDDIDALISAGAGRVVLGARALDEPDWLESTTAAFPDVLLVETAVRERRVRVRGWVRNLPVDLRDLAGELSGLRLAGLVVTFLADSLVEHGDLALVEDLGEHLPYPIFVSGGLQSLTTLRDLEFRGTAGVIISAGRIAESFDDQTLARSFVD